MKDLENIQTRLTEAYKTDLPTEQLVVAEIGFRLLPDDAWWATQYGFALLQVGRATEAEKALRFAHPRRADNRERVEWLLGDACAHQGRFNEAEEWFRLAIKTNPASTAPWVMLGGFLANRERFREACDVLELGLRAEGDIDEVYLNLGKSRRAMNDLRGARECFLKALAIDHAYEYAKAALADIDAAMSRLVEFSDLPTKSSENGYAET
jgi:tetratricopeptide (TPR) repeat protein